MRTATLISLGASAVLGLGALVVAKMFLPQPGHAPTKTQAVAMATTPVVVAKSDIPYGAKLDAARLTVAQFPTAAVPEGAYSSVPQALGHAGSPPVVLTPISAREPVLASKLSGAGAKATIAAVITEGMRAYTIGINDVAGGGGHILPGDRVDVVLTYDLATMAGGNVAGANANGKRLLTNIVLQNVRVLGMDLNADPNSTQATIAHTATLEVSARDAERLALAAEAGSLSLALRRTGSAEIASVQVVNVNDVGGFRPTPSFRAKPVPARRPSPSLASPDESQAIVVVHGSARTSVVVPPDHGSGI